MFLSLIYLTIRPAHPALQIHTCVPTSFTKRSCRCWFWKIPHMMKTVGFQQCDYSCEVIPFCFFLYNKTLFQLTAGVTLQPLPYLLFPLCRLSHCNWTDPQEVLCLCIFLHLYNFSILCLWRYCDATVIVFIYILYPFLQISLNAVFLRISLFTPSSYRGLFCRGWCIKTRVPCPWDSVLFVHILTPWGVWQPLCPH